MGARRVFLFLYFISGATALLYQVVWTRRLTLEMGQTAAAVSTVLAAFMGGLALGAHLGGRVAARRSASSALSLYAALEGAIGLLALLVAPALTAARPFLVSTYRDGDGGAVFFLTRLFLSLAVVVVPAAAMGATLPAAVRWIEATGMTGAGRLAGLLYAANTLGAAAGAALSGFVLLPSIGLAATTLVGVSANLAIVIGALLLRRFPLPPAAPDEPPARRPQPSPRKRASALPPAPVAAALVLTASGFAALVHEVAWTRVIALVVGPTTYAFTVMVSIFIVGLGAGSWLGTWLLGRLRSPLALLAWAQIVAALGAVVGAGLVPALQLSVAALVASSGIGLGQFLVRETLTFLVVLLPLTLALGASFPFAVAASASGRGSATRPVTMVYVCNTLGAIAGALSAGFVLLPRLGVQRAILAAAWTGVAAAVVLAIAKLPGVRQRAAVVAASAAVLLLSLAQPHWSHLLLAGGLYRPATARMDLEVERAASTLLYYGDGSSGSVSVRRIAGEVSLAINGKVDASTGADMLTQKLLAHVPLLMHQAPGDVLVIGLGSGVTTGAALVHPIRSVDTVELSPEVVRAAAHFADVNRDALIDPRSRLHVGDGRTHLRLARQRYDVIISEPSNLWMAGVAPLFTREAFSAARDRLESGGLFCQWAHTYELSREDFASIVATFVSVFPGSSLWLVGESDVLMVGARDGEMAPKLAALASGWHRPGVPDDLATVSALEPEALLALHVASDRRLAAFASAAPVQTDDAPTLEFTAPTGLFAARSTALVDELRRLSLAEPRPDAVARAESSVTAASWTRRATLLAGARAYDPAWHAARRALDLDAEESEACDVLERAGVPLGRLDETLAYLRALVQRSPRALSPKIGLSRLYAASGLAEAALREAVAAVQAFPGEPRALTQLASVVADAGDAVKLRPIVDHLQTVASGSWSAEYFAATLAFMEARLADAVALGERAAALDMRDGRALTLIGAAHASAGRVDQARDAFTRSLARNPRDPITSINLGRLELSTGRPREAAARFAEALLVDPASADARRGFEEATAAVARR
jgi:spermidine synthase